MNRQPFIRQITRKIETEISLTFTHTHTHTSQLNAHSLNTYTYMIPSYDCLYCLWFMVLPYTIRDNFISGFSQYLCESSLFRSFDCILKFFDLFSLLLCSLSIYLINILVCANINLNSVSSCISTSFVYAVVFILSS